MTYQQDQYTPQMKNPLALTPNRGKRTKTRDGSINPGKKS